MTFQFGPYRIDAESRILLEGDALVRIPPKAVDLLLVLVEHQGTVVPKEELFARVWPDTAVQESSLAQAVLTLRRSLKPGFGDTEFIESVPRRGYRLTVAAIPEEIPTAIPAAMPAAISDAPVSDAPVLVTGLPPGVAPVAVPSSLAKRRPSRFYPLLGLAAIVLVTLGLSWPKIRQFYQPPLELKTLTDAQEKEDDSSISADGKHVVYAWRRPGEAHYGIWIKTLGAATPTRVTNSDGDDRRPVWAPDRPMIAFVRTKDGVSEIRVISPIGEFIRTREDVNEPRVISPNTEEDKAITVVTSPDCDLAWSPDGKWLAFGDRDKSVGIRMINLETSQQRQLTSPFTNFLDSQPRFSPDGKTLGFVRRSAAEKLSNVYSVPVEGGPITQLTSVKSLVRGFDWTEDGQEIVFSSDMWGNPRLFRTQVPGQHEYKWIAEAGLDGYNPVLSTRGGRMAFTQGYIERSLFFAPGPASAESRPQTNSVPPVGEKMAMPGTRITSPAFSPDGSRFAYVSDASGSNEIWVANSNGSQPLKVTSFTEGSAGSPAWSPDGRFIAYDRFHPSQGVTQIFIVPSTGGNPRQFTVDLANHTAPAWSVDGKWIYYRSTRSGPREIWRHDVSSDAVEQITHNSGLRAKPSPDGEYLYYVHGGDSVHFLDARIWRARAAGGGEELVPEVTPLVNPANWTITARGLYWEGRDSARLPFVFFFDFASRKTTIVAADSPLYLVGDSGGIAVSPDDKTMILARIGKSVQRIMVVDGFR